MTRTIEGTTCFRISVGVLGRHRGEGEGQAQFDGWVADDDAKMSAGYSCSKNKR